MTSIHKLKNGITVVMENMPYLKSAAFGVWVRVGSANENEGNNGIAHMIEHMLFKGTKNRSAKQIADQMARIAASDMIPTDLLYTSLMMELINGAI